MSARRIGHAWIVAVLVATTCATYNGIVPNICIANGPPQTVMRTYPWNALPSQMLAFKGSSVWSFSANNANGGGSNMESDYGPRAATALFPNLPSDLDASIHWGIDDSFVFFKGTQMWRYSAEQVLFSGYPKLISSVIASLPSSLDDAFPWTGSKSYYVKGWLAYEIDESTYALSAGWPKNISMYGMTAPSPDATFGSPFTSTQSGFYLSYGADAFYWDSTLLVSRRMNLCGSCGTGATVISTGLTGLLRPFASRWYLNYQRCNYTWTMPQAGKLVLDVTAVHTELNYDFLAVHNEMTGVPLAITSGTARPLGTPYTLINTAASTPTVSLRFFADATEVLSGFNASWSFFPACATAALGTLANGLWVPASDAYFGDYRNASCNAGYVLSAGSASRLCLSTGLWNGNNAQVCTALPCSTTLVAPANGTVSSSSGSTGSLSVFGCNAGYTLSGSGSRTCLSDATWSNSADQLCVPNPCPTLSAPANGIVAPATGATGSVSLFACNTGYELSGTAARACGVTSAWSGLADQLCVAQPCSPALDAPTNGNASCLTGVTGTTCVYTCAPGYANAGGASRLCQASALWSGTPAQCTPVPCTPSLVAPANGAVSNGIGVFGDVATFSCSFGYSLSGTATRTCLASGSWSGTAGQLCAPVACPTLSAPLNGTVNPATGVLGDVVTYQCAQGFSLSGSATRVCQPSQAWTGAEPTCLALPCTPTLTAPPNGFVANGAGLVGQTAAFSCAAGYALAGTSARNCLATLVWDGLADQSCSLVANFCPSLSAPSSGTMGLLVRSLDAIVAFACDEGFSLSGSATRVCLADASWSGTAPTCSACWLNCLACAGATCSLCAPGWELGSNCTLRTDPFCPELTPPPNANFANAPCARTVDASCGPTLCAASSYVASGSTTRACVSSGDWSGAAPVCAACAPVCANCSSVATNCGACAAGFLDPPSCATRRLCAASLSAPEHGTVVPTTGVFGTNATYSCDSGYELVGVAWRECGADGEWSGAGPPSCDALPCSETLVAPAAGAVSQVNGSTGDVAVFSCVPGYLLSGAPTRICQANALWSGSSPTCVAASCSLLEPPANGALTRLAGATGDSSELLCNSGYVATGLATRWCGVDGWNGTAGACVGLACVTNLTAPTDGTVSRTSGTTGDVAEFACNSGFTLVGETARICQTSSQWSGLASPTCGPVFCPPLAQPAPDNGRKTCAGASLGQSCVFSCNLGYSAVGTAARTCRSDLSWSGAADARCSAAWPNATVTSVVGVLQVQAGEAFAVTAALFDSRSPAAPVVTGLDAVDVVELPTGATDVRVQRGVFSVVAGNYTLTAVASTVAGASVRAFRVNGVVLSETPWTLVVVPGPSAGFNSIAAGPGLTAGVIGVESLVTVTARDRFGNVQTNGAAGAADSVAVAVKVADETRVTTAAAHGSGVYSLAFVPWRGGAFTVSVTMNQQLVLNSPWLVFVLSDCEPGQYAVEPTGPCENCARSFFSDARNTPSCTPCPAGTITADVGSWSLFNCTCQPGFYTLSSGGVACDPCPIGATCAGGAAAPKAAPGFYPSRDPTVFLECSAEADACIGDGRCHSGYTGRLCADCVGGYYKIRSVCYRCATASSRAILFLFIVGVFVFVAVLVRLNTRSTRFVGLGAFVIGFNALQITAIYGDIDLGWPNFAARFFAALSALNLNFELSAPECNVSISSPFLFKYFLALAIPILVLLPFFVAWAAGRVYIVLVERYGERFRARHPDWCVVPPAGVSLGQRVKLRVGRLCAESIVKPRALLDATGRAYWQMLIFCFMPLCRATMRFFACAQTKDGVWVLTDSPTTTCFTSKYWAVAWTAALGVLVYCVGIPLGITLLLRYKRRTMAEVKFELAYGFLVGRFRWAHYLYEPLGVMVQKLLVVAMATAFSTPRVKATWAAMVLLVSALQLAYSGPYREHWHNLLGTVCIGSGAVTLFGGLVSFSAPTRTALIALSLLALVGSILLGVGYDLFVVARAEKDDEAALDDSFFVKSDSTHVAAARARGISGVELTHLDDEPSDPRRTSASTYNNPVFMATHTPESMFGSDDDLRSSCGPAANRLSSDSTMLPTPPPVPPPPPPPVFY